MERREAALCRMCLQARLLAELHWRLAHELSPAEERLRDVQLPRLEKAGQELASSVQVCEQPGTQSSCCTAFGMCVADAGATVVRHTIASMAAWMQE